MRFVDYSFVKKIVYVEFLLFSAASLSFAALNVIQKDFLKATFYIYLIAFFMFFLTFFSSGVAEKTYHTFLNHFQKIKSGIKKYQSPLEKLAFASLTITVILTILSLFNINIFSFLGAGAATFFYFAQHILTFN